MKEVFYGTWNDCAFPNGNAFDSYGCGNNLLQSKNYKRNGQQTAYKPCYVRCKSPSYNNVLSNGIKRPVGAGNDYGIYMLGNFICGGDSNFLYFYKKIG